MGEELTPIRFVGECMLCDPPRRMLAGDAEEHRQHEHPDWPPPFPGGNSAYRWDDPGPDEMMPDCGHEVMDAAGTYDTGSGPAPGRGCER